MDPPLILKMDEDETAEKQQEENDAEEESFLNFKKEEGEEAAIATFEDTDYSEGNAKLNRVKQFTFIKEQRPTQ